MLLTVAALAYSLLGFITGLFNGMFGIGGGIVITPGLLAIFSLLKVPEAHATHLAVGTSLTYILITSSVTSFFYARLGMRMTKERLFLFCAALLGGIFGSILAIRSPAFMLRALLGLVELGVGVQLFLAGSLRSQASSSLEGDSQRKASLLSLGLLGVACGMLSPLTGVGGGVVAVPAMVLWYGVPYRQAAANGAFMVIGSALFSMAFFVLGGLHLGVAGGRGVYPFSLTPVGFVSPLALVCLLPFGIFGAKVGSRVAVKANPASMQLLLAYVLIAVGLFVLLPAVLRLLS
jgi:hypothetical protein